MATLARSNKQPVEERIAVVETHVENIQNDISDVRSDIKEVHSRITTTTREIVDKIDTCTESIKSDATDQHNMLAGKMNNMDTRISEIERWRYVLIGAALVIGYVLAHIDIAKLF
jgi:archaellum component FlaC